MKQVPISVLSLVTFVCSILSVLGSTIVISSYRIARTRSKPKAAQLIHNLAVTDFVWFLASLIMSSFWLLDPDSNDSNVPTFVCYLVTPLISFTRLGSLVWTCAVSFDVYMSVNRRRWEWKDEEDRWNLYRRRYILIVLLLASPATLINLIKQHLSPENAGLGCSPGYEKLGNWYYVVFTEVLPIVCGFACNCTVYFLVRNRMSQKVFPQSVRKRRRRIMYYYMIACIWSWTPTIVFYIIQLAQLPQSVYVEGFEVFSRASLYLTGFVNFLIFGMSDPHLSRSFSLVLYFVGCECCVNPDYMPSAANRTSTSSLHAANSVLKTRDVDKTVMFGGPISDHADKSSTKRESLRYKLSAEQKRNLYINRPDLDTRSEILEPLMKKKKKKKPAASAPDASGANSDLSTSSENPELLHEILAQQAMAEKSGSNSFATERKCEDDSDVETGLRSNPGKGNKQSRQKDRQWTASSSSASSGLSSYDGPSDESSGAVWISQDDDGMSVSSDGSSANGVGISISHPDDLSSSDEDDDEDMELKSPLSPK